MIMPKKYKHYKGGLYERITVGDHTETGEAMVVYKDENGKVWIRPAEMFYGPVKHNEKWVDRFKEIPDGENKTFTQLRREGY